MTRPQRTALALALSGLTFAACAAEGPPLAPSGATSSGPASVASTAAVASAHKAGAAPPCARDADCGWDEPCMPSRCIPGGKRRSQGVACEESAPDPGLCVCAVGACTLKPK